MSKAVKELISASTIARVTHKATGKLLGFLVKSDTSNEYYQVTSVMIAGERVFSCTCEAGKRGFAGCQKYGHCKHVQAVVEVTEARKALQANKQEEQAAVEEAERIVSKPVVAAPVFQNKFQQKPLTPEEKRRNAPLNGNAGFQLLK